MDKQREWTARVCPCTGELDEGGPFQLPGRGVVGHLIDRRIILLKSLSTKREATMYC